MKKIVLIIALTMFFKGVSQTIIELPHESKTEITWDTKEKEYHSDIWQTEVVTNVSTPTMEVYKAKNPNGTSVIVAPGGGLYALSINSEGRDVAKWLIKKGITVFVLKYRLVPAGEDAVQEITDESTTNPTKIGERVAPVLPLSIADGLAAIEYVRTNSKKMNLDPNKIGFMGFSAGGAVTMGVTSNYTTNNKPDFIVPVYPWMTVIGEYKVPENAPPLLVICASDDPLGLAKPSADLYSKWLTNGKTAGLHMYSKGGHGFGMKKQQLPSDNWIQRFYEWALTENLTTVQKI